uniref:Uncharacterized protein n=1 Tax=Picea sitchensis TaxID=3332 RepID=A9NVK9_PICSI|nr:unknown [Picea sitchensis]
MPRSAPRPYTSSPPTVLRHSNSVVFCGDNEEEYEGDGSVELSEVCSTGREPGILFSIFGTTISDNLCSKCCIWSTGIWTSTSIWATGCRCICWQFIS